MPSPITTVMGKLIWHINICTIEKEHNSKCMAYISHYWSSPSVFSSRYLMGKCTPKHLSGTSFPLQCLPHASTSRVGTELHTYEASWSYLNHSFESRKSRWPYFPTLGYWWKGQIFPVFVSSWFKFLVLNWNVVMFIHVDWAALWIVANT